MKSAYENLCHRFYQISALRTKGRFSVGIGALHITLNRVNERNGDVTTVLRTGKRTDLCLSLVGARHSAGEGPNRRTFHSAGVPLVKDVEQSVRGAMAGKPQLE